MRLELFILPLNLCELSPTRNSTCFIKTLIAPSRWKFLVKSIIDQSDRYGHHQAACRQPAGSYDKTTRTAICFEHKTQYLLIRAPYTRIVVFWHISNIPPMISQSQISRNTPTLYIAAIFVYNRQLVVITHELIYGVRAAIC